MGVNLWGVSPLYVNPAKALTEVLAENKGGTARDRLKGKIGDIYDKFCQGENVGFPSLFKD